MTKIPEKQALRYMGVRGEADGAVLSQLRAVAAEYEKNIEPSHALIELPCEISENSVSVSGMTFESRSLAEHLAGCESVLLFAATLGAAADTMARAFSVRASAAGTAAQACGAAMVEQYCDDVCDALEEKYSERGLHLLPRFSPGYGDLDIKTQREFFALLDVTRRLGITLTDTMMMTPSKSVTAFIGLTKSSRHGISKCIDCEKTDCPFRREAQ